MSERPPMWMGWSQLARYAGVHPDTLRRWSRLPGFPAVSYPTSRRPRVSREAFDAWLAAQAGPRAAPGVDQVLAEIRGRKRA